MAKKTSVYFNEPLLWLVDGHPSTSGRLKVVAERYRAILREHSVSLSSSDSEVLSRLLTNETIDPMFIRFLPQYIESRLPGSSLASTISTCSYADIVSVIEALKL